MTIYSIPGHPKYSLADNGDGWLVIGPRGPMKGWLQKDPGRTQALRPFFGLDQESHQLGRIVLLALVGVPPVGRPFACHRNGDSFDNRLVNLYWGSAKDNADDAARHGKHMANTPRGASHYKTSIPQATIDAVRAEYVRRPPGQPKGRPRGGGLLPGSTRWLAEKYGLRSQDVMRIINNRTRKAAA